MDFFEAQDHARRLSHRLVALYALAVLGIIVGTYAAVWVAFGFAPDVPVGAGAPGGGFFDPALFALVAVGIGILVGGGASYRTAQLRKGGSAVAELLGGRRVDPMTSDPKEQMLLNVVEEMAIASGVPVPEVFVMDREAGINAFAAGHTLNDAAVAVTRGALEAFSRDELQGVMAHEFSHILNGDMRLNVRLMGVLFGILVLTVVGRGILRAGFWGGRGGGRRSGGGRDGSGGQLAVVGIALVVLGYLGVLVGRLIQAAVSRQREFLADAAAVEFTRNPEGIANALKRIGASSHGSRLKDHHAEEASHFFFARGVGRAVSGLTATHPPLPERVRRIDPNWDGSWEVPVVRTRREVPRRGAGGAGAGPGGLGIPIPGFPGGADTVPGGRGALLLAVLSSAGTLGEGQVAEAQRLLSAIPDEARRRLRTPEGAIEAVLALLLPEDPGARTRGEAAIERRLGPRPARGAVELQPLARAAGAEARLPLLELALPALRQLPRERAAALRDAVADLIRADGEIRPFEYAAYHLVRRNLPAATKAELPSRRGGNAALSALAGEAALVLSTLAWSGAGAGEGRGERARAAFRAGTKVLEASGSGIGAGLPLVEADAVGLEAVDEALTALEAAAPGARKVFLEACAAVVGADGEVELEEAELLRAFAESLEVPLPPVPGLATPAPKPEAQDG